MKGIYILIISLSKTMKIKVGAIGDINFAKGHYAYVGSAQNNLEKRVQRHMKKNKKLKWHIDYLTSDKSATVEKVLYKLALKSEECKTADILSQTEEGIKNFGCSDCKCQSHLFKLNKIDLNELLPSFSMYNPDKPGKYGLKENEKTKQLHKSRRMFCIKDNNLFIAKPNVAYSHAVWFEKEGWIKEDSTIMDKITRGMLGSEGNLYFCVGYDFKITKKAEKEFFNHILELTKKLNVSRDAKIYGGFIKGKPGEKWSPNKCYGTVQSLSTEDTEPTRKKRNVSK
ncbi:MAG: GIY-YIG nuclease family protein [Candidatus Aenigmarchaeota archaeon]|nr:GIY-YIG nuclease family protein [Candidatus Aenigmarchaeota archaeon]